MIKEMTCDKLWKQFEALLEEAVTQNSFDGVEMLLQQETLLKKNEGKVNPHKGKPKYNIPFLLAAKNGNLDIINLFLNHDYEIPTPHLISCSGKDCQSDKLGQTRHRLLTLKALGNPVWLSLTSDDPFLTLFTLNRLHQKHVSQNDSFQREYDDMRKENEQLCTDLLDEVRTEDEGLTLMRYKSTDEDMDIFGDLPFINLAIDYQEKEVVAHPVLQHFLTAKVFADIPRWETSSIVYKAFFVLFIAIIYPITALLNILSPSNCLYSIRDIAMKPLVKFVNGAASFITFLILLIVLGSTERNGIRTGKAPTSVEIAIFVWIIGFSIAECKQAYRRGMTDYLSSGWNWVDIGMDTLMLFAFTNWIVVCFYKPDNDDVYETIMDIADGAFTVGMILSFFRIIYLCQITSYLGLLQLCLGEMVLVIAQVAFICIIVLVAFTVAMIYLFNASKKGKSHLYDIKYVNKTAIFSSFSENFNGFVSTMFTMIHVSLGMGNKSMINDFADGTLIQLWAHIAFIVYFAITMIVVLNMLIAMMNNSYQKIADNLTAEHMYSRTTLWMEYIGNEQTCPVPFNLIPAVNNIVNLISYMKQLLCNSHMDMDDFCRTESLFERKMRYTELCSVLVERYMRKRYGRTIHDESTCRNPLANRINRHIEEWTTVQTIRDIIGKAKTSNV